MIRAIHVGFNCYRARENKRIKDRTLRKHIQERRRGTLERMINKIKKEIQEWVRFQKHDQQIRWTVLLHAPYCSSGMSTDKTLEGLEMRKSAVILIIREVLVALWGRRRKWGWKIHFQVFFFPQALKSKPNHGKEKKKLGNPTLQTFTRVLPYLQLPVNFTILLFISRIYIQYIIFLSSFSNVL